MSRFKRFDTNQQCAIGIILEDIIYIYAIILFYVLNEFKTGSHTFQNISCISMQKMGRRKKRKEHISSQYLAAVW